MLVMDTLEKTTPVQKTNKTKRGSKGSRKKEPTLEDLARQRVALDKKVQHQKDFVSTVEELKAEVADFF